jgi:aminomethyltransferase
MFIMKTTPLYHRHLELGAQMTEFAGYQMPVRYTGDKLEHMAVREKAGLFDVSHMGEIWVTGSQAEQAITHLVTQDPTKYSSGQAFYGLLLNQNGGIVDDIITYKFSSEKFLICVNASNREKDFDWIKSNCDAQVEDASDNWSQIAIQGPEAVAITARYLGAQVLDIKRFGFIQLDDLIIARTGYTGEDGFEIFVPNERATELWDALSKEAMPCGLAARDTLRLEAGMCLYGHDINDQTNPIEAGLGWCAKKYQVSGEIKRRLVGLMMQGTGIARPDYEVCNQTGMVIGHVTSGTKTPYLNQAIAMAYIDRPYCDALEEVYVKIRGRLEPAKITKLPFYRRAK